MRVFVLLFNARTDNEGIHTLRMGDQDVVLMFESEDDATRFGVMLEAQDFASPSVEAFDSEEIEAFCEGANYECRIVPEGTLMLPPEANLEQTDWQLEDSGTASQSTTADLESNELSSSELDQIRRKLEGLL
ncbi:MAG: DUF3110 domain-containing protein [Elainella sp. Prado103]|jgi:hypothetical protein|nr:DUF3110 domain-containing protein [Elainella sp. Prado103]